MGYDQDGSPERHVYCRSGAFTGTKPKGANSLRWSLLLSAFIVGVATTGLNHSAHATVLTGTSSAFGESIQTSVSTSGAPSVFTSGPSPSVSGVAPPPYDISASLAAVSFGGNNGIFELAVNAASNVDGAIGSRFASGSSSALAANVSLPVFSFNFDHGTGFSSFAMVSGNPGALVAFGSTDFTGFGFLQVDTLNPTFIIFDTSPAANDVVFDMNGIRVVENEQTVVGDGSTHESIVVNALDVSFTNVLVDDQVLNGGFMISHSQAALTASGGMSVPEPTGLLLLGSGLLGIMGARLRAQGKMAS